MDYRCPHCGRDLAKRKLAQSIIARMEIECPGCMKRLVMNIHQVESGAMLLYAASFVGLVVAGYLLGKDSLIAAGVIAGAAGAAAVYVIERTYLRRWQRYLRKGESGPQ